jgi:UDP-4-amino-4,6-dideoxy-N-acetyl-beta-L-altrosamine N-acetyltransferase
MRDLAEFALRPVARGDAERLLRWRNDDRVRANMYTDHVIAPEEHARWFAGMLEDPRVEYLIGEHAGRPIGMVAFTHIDAASRRASWAFYVGERAAPPGSGAALEFLALEHAFGARGLRKLSCEVLAFNARVVKLHRKFGFRQEGLLAAHALKNGRFEDVVLLALLDHEWPPVRERLRQTLFGASAASEEAC